MRRARPLLSAELALILGMLALVGVGYLAEHWLWGGESAPMTVPVALAAATFPAAVWFFALRTQTRDLASTPLIVGLFVLGALVAGPAARLVADNLGAAHPLASSPSPELTLPRVVSAIAVVGLSYEAAKYLAIRYAALPRSREQPLALIVYATAVALGVAAHESYRELTELGASPAGAGALRIMALMLAHAALGVLIALVVIAAVVRQMSPLARAATLTGGVLVAAAGHGAMLISQQTIAAEGLLPLPSRADAVIAAAAAAALSALTFTAARLCVPRKAAAADAMSEGVVSALAGPADEDGDAAKSEDPREPDGARAEHEQTEQGSQPEDAEGNPEEARAGANDDAPAKSHDDAPAKSHDDAPAKPQDDAPDDDVTDAEHDGEAAPEQSADGDEETEDQPRPEGVSAAGETRSGAASEDPTPAAPTGPDSQSDRNRNRAKRRRQRNKARGKGKR